MSIVETPVDLDQGRPGTQPGPSGLERMPPQDVMAEQCALGAMLLSKDAVADVSEVLKGVDFYRPAHEMIYEAVIDLFGRGEPADPVTVADVLGRRGELNRVGGAPYLHTLVATVPTAASAAYYARIVRDKAVLRRLVEAGTKIAGLGYAGEGGEVDDIVNQAQAEVYAVTERQSRDDYRPLAEVMQDTVTELEEMEARPDGMHGVPTGFRDLDQLTNGLQAGQMIVVAARPAVGKALALDTPLPTPTGWTTMGEVRVGDELLDAAGRATRVVRATDVMPDRPCFELRFDDGTVVVADAQHEWLTDAGAGRAVRTTERLARETAAGHVHRVPVTSPLAMPPAAVPHDPYVMGATLGELCGEPVAAGSREVDPEVRMRVDAVGVDARGDAVLEVLRVTRRLGEPRVPAVYRRASVEQRRALLAGLLDVAGGVGPDGTVHARLLSPGLAADVRELLVGLGHRVLLDGDDADGAADGAGAHVVRALAHDDVFWASGPQLLHKQRRSGAPAPARALVAVRAVPSVPVRCVEVDNPDHLYLATRSMVPTHNSTLGLDVARAAAIHHNMATVIFSLEMSRTEITTRLISAEAGIKLQALRTGKLQDSDWQKIARVLGQSNDAPLFIDDSPNMSLPEIRAKCRRLKQQHNLRLIVVDYLQLMTSGKRVESRQQEVSEFSRALKLLAKELEVPLIAISQLNRGPEQRTDKKPQMSDLRESGCLTADTRVLRADTGAEITMGELFASGARDVPVWSLDESLRYVTRHLTHVFPTGTREVFRLRLASGKEVRATANHPFMAYEGWTPLEALVPGSRIAVPRHVPAPSLLAAWDDAEVIMLAHLLGDGSFVRRQPVRYASVDEENLAVVTEAARHFGITAVRDEHAAARCTSLRLPAPYRLTHGRRNPIASWLDGLGLFGLRSHEKFVPDAVSQLPKAQIALFLRHIWATDGSVTVRPDGTGGRIYYASTSRQLVDQLSRLLLRFGISTRLRRATLKSGYRQGWTLDVSGVDDQRRFLQEIGVHGERGSAAARLLDVVRGGRSNPNVDTVPRQVWDDVRQVLADRGMTHREFAAAMGTQFCGSTMWKHSPSRQRLAKVAEVLDSAELEIYAINDLLWDEVVSIEPDGVEQVFDATVVGKHNFIANGISVHNSIEQDADMVVLLHREDAYDKDVRPGEADFIVAKHRNGPTDTITVVFQGHYSRFMDMAH